MELKTGKRKGVNGDELRNVDISELKYDISVDRELSESLRADYEKATSDEDKKLIGSEINALNASIKGLRAKLKAVATDSLFKANFISAEVKTIKGELYKYRDIDEGKIEAVINEFGEYYYKIPDVRDNVILAMETATGEDRRILEERLDILNVITLRADLGGREEMIKSLLPDDDTIQSTEDVAMYGEILANEEMRRWFDNGDIRNESLEIIRHGRGVLNVGDDGYDEYDDNRNKKIVGVIDHAVSDIKDSVNRVDGVDKKSKRISFSNDDLNELANVTTPEEMIKRINELCTLSQMDAFSDALGDIDKEGHIVETTGIACDIKQDEIYSAFERMHDLMEGVPGSSHEYMTTFLKKLFKYDAFDDYIYDDMSRCDDIDELMGIIRKEIPGCSCHISDIHEEAVIRAFDYRGELESRSKGKGITFMNSILRNIFNCDTFDDDVYMDMADYEDPDDLLQKINDELSDAGVYDKDVLDASIDGINRDTLLNASDTEKQLDDVFGDHFTKGEYMDVASNIRVRGSAVDRNLESLIMCFSEIGYGSKILTGKILEGISDDDYAERWDKEIEKMKKHGETKNIETVIKNRQIEDAKKRFASLVSGIPDDSMLSREEIVNVFEVAGLKPHVINKLSASITDIGYVIDDNLKILSRGMSALIRKHDMYEDDIFNEGMVCDALQRSKRLDLGDSKAAIEHMKSAISSVVGRLDMSEYGETIVEDARDEIYDRYNDITLESALEMKGDDIADTFVRTIERYKRDAEISITEKAERAIEDLYAGREQGMDVAIPKNKAKDASSKKTEEVKVVIKDKTIEPFLISADIDDYRTAIPKRPKKPKTAREKAELEWWEGYMNRINPVIERTDKFNEAGFALVRRTGVGSTYTVYGEGGESLGFNNLKELDKWFKTNYGKR
jgi:hypothetical protein